MQSLLAETTSPGESKMKKLFLFVPIMAAVFAMSAQPARADLLLSLGLGNAAISGFTGPFGFVNVHLVSATQAEITYTGNTVAGNDYLFGDGGSVGLNFNGGVGSFAITGGPSNAGTGFTNSAGDISLGGAGSEDGFGSFNFPLAALIAISKPLMAET
jgi:hypothetical protein